MDKPIIAVDIDDVLSASAEGFVNFSNRHFGTALTVDDYDDDWLSMWQVELDEGARRRDLYISMDKRMTYAIKSGAQESLQHLAKRYRLLTVTSRISALEVATQEWLDRHFPGLFESVHFSGIYEGRANIGRITWTKGELLQKLGAKYLVDDQYKHCASAAEAGIEAILFGNYAWNHADKLPSGVTRCKDWAAVVEFFNGR